MSDDQIDLDERLKNAKEHISIPWDELYAIEDMTSYRNPLLQFARIYNYYRDKHDDAQGWAEHVLTKLTHAETLDDLHSFKTGDWYVCAMLLQSDLPVPRKIIGKLLEKILEELHPTETDVPALGIKKTSRGRPSNPKDRERYLIWLMFEVQRLTTKQGMTATEAYAVIAEKQHKSPDTIRRDYERFKKERERCRKELKVK